MHLCTLFVTLSQYKTIKLWRVLFVFHRGRKSRKKDEYGTSPNGWSSRNEQKDKTIGGGNADIEERRDNLTNNFDDENVGMTRL